MSLSLYAVTDEYVELARQLQDSELPAEVIQDTLEGLKYPIEEKGRAIATVVANMNAEIEAIENAVAKLIERSAKITKRSDWLMSYLLVNMQRSGILKIVHPMFTIAIRKNPEKVLIEDQSAVPEEFYGPQKPPPPREISKTLIKAAIQSGREVPGARITQEERLEIKT